MFDSDSSKDLTSGAVGGIGGGRQIMKTSWASTSPAPAGIADDFS
jgi:hypothetical protein